MTTSKQVPVVLMLTLLGGLSFKGAMTFAGETWTSFQNGGRVSLDILSETPTCSLSGDIAWTAELTGYGQSSPLVWDRQVYVTSVTGTNKETYHVTAFGLDDGSQLWEVDVSNATPQESSNYVTQSEHILI